MLLRLWVLWLAWWVIYRIKLVASKVSRMNKWIDIKSSRFEYCHLLLLGKLLLRALLENNENDVPSGSGGLSAVCSHVQFGVIVLFSCF